MTITDQLRAQLERYSGAPFLFVGSGISRRYLGAETWEDLLRRFAAHLPQPFDYYRSRANAEPPRIATLMIPDFHEVWWKHPAYSESRTMHSSEMHDQASCLKHEIAAHLQRQNSPGSSAEAESEIALLRQAVVDGIITTNWDTFLEQLFPDFRVYVGQQTILSSHPQGVAEIYKIHGCCRQPSSLVLHESDYQAFNERNPYLTAKLLTIFVEHPVIFLGYSLSDRNVQALLQQLAKCLAGGFVESLRDKLLFVVRDSTAQGECLTSTAISVGGQTIPVTLIRTNDFTKVYQALITLRRRLPARVLRILKEQIYELVAATEKKPSLAVVDFEKAESLSDLQIVYGVGVIEKISQVGYCAISADDLLHNVIDEKAKYDPLRIVTEVLPGLLKGNRKSVPVFMYLRAAGLFTEDGNLREEGLDSRVVEMAKATQESFYPPHQYHRKMQGARSTYLGALDCATRLRIEHAILQIPLLREDQLDVEEVKQIILANIDQMNSKNPTCQTYFRRLICLYDWLLHRRIVRADTARSGIASPARVEG